MRHVIQQGVLTPISALFPSTTAASVTTLNFGVLPSVHAVYEWNIYVPAFGEVIQSLPFAPLGSHASDACLAQGYDPALLVAVHETAHQRLAKKGVRSIQFAHRKYARSAYNKLANAGAEVVEHVRGKALLSFYWDSIDTIAHIHGPGTSFHRAEIVSFWQTFDHLFRDIKAADTLYLFTADHGHVYADALQTIYINERIPGFEVMLAVSPTGKVIYPNGSPMRV